MGTMTTVAVIQTAFIGDVVLATPLFESARRALPEARIVGVVRTGCANILENNPYIDDVLSWDKHGRDRGIRGVVRMASRLRKMDIDFALVPHRSARTGLVAFLSGATERVGFNRGGGAVFHTRKVPWMMGIHEVERNLRLAGALGWPVEGFRPAVYPDDRDRTAVDAALTGTGTFCIFAPGSVWPTKMWPSDFYAETGAYFSRLGFRVLISGGAGDRDVCAGIARAIPDALDLSGTLTLRQSAELYRRSRFVLTGDTAPQHLAAAAGARVFSIFGPTVREFGFWPYTDRGTVIEINESCRPCGIHGHTNCPERTHRCMRRITSDMVIGIIERELA